MSLRDGILSETEWARVKLAAERLGMKLLLADDGRSLMIAELNAGKILADNVITYAMHCAERAASATEEQG